MAILRTADFVAQGRTDAQASRARGALVAERFPRDSKSWQAKAYWSGFDEETERLKNSSVLTQKLDLAMDRFSIFPRSRAYFSIKHPTTMVVRGPLYPKRVKGRSRREGGWTGA